MKLDKKDLNGLKELKAAADDFNNKFFEYAMALNETAGLDALTKMQKKINDAINEIENDYYTFEDWNGDVCDKDYSSYNEAHDAAEEKLGDENDDAPNGATFSEDITIIHYKYNDDGDRVELDRTDDVAEYTAYHGDYAEHNTMCHSMTGCY